MAFLTDAAAPRFAPLRPIADFARRISAGWAARARRVQTYRELSMLTDRELDDLGICRADIGQIAREVAHEG